MTNSILLLLAVSAASSATAFKTVSSMRRTAIRVQMMTSDTPSTDSAVSTFASDSPVKSSDSGDLEIDFDSLASESAAKAFTPKSDISSMYVSPESRKNPRMAKWFPMLLSPESLDGTYAGDVGFDPLGFSNGGRIVKMREAEIKHARLAMLAAAGWPLSELWHKDFARMLELDDLLVGEGKAPSVLNGGLTNEWVILAGAMTLAIGGFLEFKSFEMSQKAGYKPGDYGFDPLGLYALRASFGLDRVDVQLTREEKLASGKADMELCEIKNGRLAMIAITGYAGQEFLLNSPVVQQTPFFFGDPIM